MSPPTVSDQNSQDEEEHVEILASPPPRRHSHQSPSGKQMPLAIVSKETLANFTYINNRSLYIAPYIATQKDERPRGRSPSPFRGRSPSPSPSPLRTFGGRLRSKSLSLIGRGSRHQTIDKDKPLPPLPPLPTFATPPSISKVPLPTPGPTSLAASATSDHRHLSEFGTSASSASTDASDLFGSFPGKLDDAIAAGLANSNGMDMSTFGSRVARGVVARSAGGNGDATRIGNEHRVDGVEVGVPKISLPITRGLELRKRKRSPDEETTVLSLPQSSGTSGLRIPMPLTNSRKEAGAYDDHELVPDARSQAQPAAYASSPTMPSAHNGASSPTTPVAFEQATTPTQPATPEPTPSPPSARPRDPRRHASIYSGPHEWLQAAENPRDMSFVGSYEWHERDERWDLVKPFIKKRKVEEKD